MLGSKEFPMPDDVPNTGGHVVSTAKSFLNKVQREYSSLSGDKLEPMYYIQPDSGDSTMVTPFDAFEILLPEYLETVPDEFGGKTDIKGQMTFFSKGGKGFELLNALVNRKKRNK